VPESYARLEHGKWMANLEREAEAKADRAATVTHKKSTPPSPSQAKKP